MTRDREISPPPLRARRRGDSYHPSDQPTRWRIADTYRPGEGDRLFRSDPSPPTPLIAAAPVIIPTTRKNSDGFDYSNVPKGPKPKPLVDRLGDYDVVEGAPTEGDMKSSYICLTLDDPLTKQDVIWRGSHLQHFYNITQGKTLSSKIPRIRKYVVNGTQCFIFFGTTANLDLLDIKHSFQSIKLFGKYNVDVVEISEGAVSLAGDSRESTPGLQSARSSSSSANGVTLNRESPTQEQGNPRMDIYTPPTAPEDQLEKQHSKHANPPSGPSVKCINTQQLNSSTPPYSPALPSDIIHRELASPGSVSADVDASSRPDVLATHKLELLTSSRDTSYLSSQLASSEMSSSRFSNENQCAKCKGQATGINPLVACTSCRRKYHDSCKNRMNLPAAAGPWVCKHCVKKTQRDRDPADNIAAKTTARDAPTSSQSQPKSTPVSLNKANASHLSGGQSLSSSTIRPGPNAFGPPNTTPVTTAQLQKIQRARTSRPLMMKAFGLDSAEEDDGTDASMDISDDSTSAISPLNQSQNARHLIPDVRRSNLEQAGTSSFQQEGRMSTELRSNTAMPSRLQSSGSSSPMRGEVAHNFSPGNQPAQNTGKTRSIDDDRPLRERWASMKADFEAEGYKVELATGNIARGVEAYSFIASTSDWFRPWSFAEPHLNPNQWSIELLVALSELIASWKSSGYGKQDPAKIKTTLGDAIRKRTADPRRQKLSVADIHVAVDLVNKVKMTRDQEVLSLEPGTEAKSVIEGRPMNFPFVDGQTSTSLPSQPRAEEINHDLLSHGVQLSKGASKDDGCRTPPVPKPLAEGISKAQAKRQKCTGCGKIVFSSVPTCATCPEKERLDHTPTSSPGTPPISPSVPPSLSWLMNPPSNRQIRTVRRSDLDVAGTNPPATPVTSNVLLNDNINHNEPIQEPTKGMPQTDGTLSDRKTVEEAKLTNIPMTLYPTQPVPPSPAPSSILSNPPSTVVTPTPEAEALDLPPLDGPIDNNPAIGFFAPLELMSTPIANGQATEEGEEELSSSRTKRRRGASTAQINLRTAISLALSREPKRKTAREVISWILEYYPNAKTDRTAQQWMNTVSGTCSLGSSGPNPWLQRFEAPVLNASEGGPKKRGKGAGSVTKWTYALVSTEGLSKYEMDYQEALRAEEEAGEEAEEELQSPSPTKLQSHVMELEEAPPAHLSEPTRLALPLSVPIQTNSTEIEDEPMVDLSPDISNNTNHLPDPHALDGLWRKWRAEGRKPPAEMPEYKGDYWDEEETDSEEEEFLKFLNTNPELSRPDDSCTDLYEAHPELRPEPEGPLKPVINFRKRSKRTLPDSTFGILSKPRVELPVAAGPRDSDDENEEESFFVMPKFHSIEDALRIPTDAVMSLDDARKHLTFRDTNPRSRKVFRVGTPPRR